MTAWKTDVGMYRRKYRTHISNAFSRRRISSMWFYRLSSELYFAKTGAREEPDRTGIRNYEWETSPATVLISSAPCNFSNESRKASSVFVAMQGLRERKRPLFICNSSFSWHYLSDIVLFKKKSHIIRRKKGYLKMRFTFRTIFKSDLLRGLIRRKVRTFTARRYLWRFYIFNLSRFPSLSRGFFFLSAKARNHRHLADFRMFSHGPRETRSYRPTAYFRPEKFNIAEFSWECHAPTTIETGKNIRYIQYRLQRCGINFRATRASTNCKIRSAQNFETVDQLKVFHVYIY